MLNLFATFVIGLQNPRAYSFTFSSRVEDAYILRNRKKSLSLSLSLKELDNFSIEAF